MSFDAMLWAWENAPVADLYEKAVLMALANCAHADGTTAYPSKATIADEAMCDPDHVKKILRRLEDRGLIAKGNQAAVTHLAANKRPVVYDLMIPYSWYSPDRIKKVNEKRDRAGLPPLTPEMRPDLGGPPPRKARRDKGVPNPNRGRSATPGTSTGATPDLGSDLGVRVRGVSETPQGQPFASASGGFHRPPQGGFTDPSRGVSETPKPVIDKPVLKNLKNNHSPLRGECVYAHDAHASADAGTREDADHEPVRDDATDPWAEDRPTVNPGTRNRTPATPNPVVDDRPGGNPGHADDLTGCVAPDPVPTRLTRDWTPTPDLHAWAAANVPGLDLDHETDEFRHYWAVEAPARDPKSPRAKRPKNWEKVDWGRAWQNRMREQWRRQGLDRRPRPAADELDLFADTTTADAQPVADEITAWWGTECRARYGGVLPTALTKLRELVALALVGGFDRSRIETALVACAQAGEPFPPQWILQRALTGQPPRPPASATGGTMTRQEAEQREWDERFARKLEEAAEFDAVGDYSDEAIIGSILSKAVQRAADTRQSEEPGVDVQQVKIIRKGIAQ